MVESFTRLTKKQDDLLNKYFCFSSSASYAINTELFGIYKGGLCPFNFSFQRTFNDLSLKLVKNKEKETSLIGKWSPNASFEGKLSWIFPERYHYSLAYAHSVFHAQIDTDNFKTQVAVTAGKGHFGHGLCTKFTSEKLESFDLAAWWSRNSSKIVLKQEKFEEYYGKTAISYYQELSSTSRVASLFQYSWTMDEAFMEIGGECQYDNSTLIKAKMDTNGEIALAVHREISNNCNLIFALKVDVMDSDNQGLGLRFNINHK